MGFFDDLFKGQESKVESVSKLSTEQQKLLQKYIENILPMLGQGATPYPGTMVAGTPELFNQAYQTFSGSPFGEDISRATLDMIQGTPAYTFSPERATKQWQETYATPVMRTWEDTVMPMIKEGFNIPGVYYSRGRGKGVSEEASRFYGGYVAPTLFSTLQRGEQLGAASLEAAAGRRAGALSLPYQRFMQQAGASQMFQAQEQAGLTAAYQEWLRTRPEASPWWSLAQAGFGAPTMETVGFQGYSPLGDIANLTMAASKMFGDSQGGSGSESDGGDVDWGKLALQAAMMYAGGGA